MKRLTYDFCVAGNHCWQIKGADNLECREVCQQMEEKGGCKACPIANAFNRLAAIENILGDDYDLDRLRDLAQADRDGRCVVLPKDGMLYLHEESIDSDERWVGNWPIKDVLLKCGFGIASLTYSIKDVGRKIYFSREAAEAALKEAQDEKEDNHES